MDMLSKLLSSPKRAVLPAPGGGAHGDEAAVLQVWVASENSVATEEAV